MDFIPFISAHLLLDSLVDHAVVIADSDGRKYT
jgi:hypothetical protein